MGYTVKHYMSDDDGNDSGGVTAALKAGTPSISCEQIRTIRAGVKNTKAGKTGWGPEESLTGKRIKPENF